MILWEVEKILFKDGVKNQVYLETDSSGKIININFEKADKAYSEIKIIKGLVLPGFQNAHSHSFQYAMAGMSENLQEGHEDDDFWSWRNHMYQLALKVNPDQLESIAKMLYSEMLRLGYTQVAEFHYLHHDESGKAYSQKSELSERLMRAAQEVGIRLCLLPIFYQKGGFGVNPLEQQKRFITATTDDYFKFLEEIQNKAKSYDLCNVGCGVHSLRAAGQNEVREIIEQRSGPFHIHIAEQIKEVEECLSHWGKRPVQWLCDKTTLDENVFLVHATHLDQSEIKELAKTKAQIVVCPTTEGNLGDGIIPLVEFEKLGGAYSIGSDSHICLSPQEEIKLLDYAQRYRLRKRNPLIQKAGQDSAQYLLTKTWESGRKSCGQGADYDFFTVGQDFDAVIIDTEHPSLLGKKDQDLCASFIYAADTNAIKDTIVRGRKYSNLQRDQIKKDYKNSLNSLFK
ncbi:MAG: formimidoylglutamate deiminase [Bdellovibrionales bacterium]|nr:formimidoylglutamate deiminase [Bdellovibrionales bacterium]